MKLEKSKGQRKKMMSGEEARSLEIISWGGRDTGGVKVVFFPLNSSWTFPAFNP